MAFTMHFLSSASFCFIGNRRFFKEIKKAAGIRGHLSENEVVDGLKQALEIGTSNAVKSVSTVNGYYENPMIKIPLPASIQKVKKLYVTNQTLNGLFLMLAEEERKICQDPAARVTDLLKQMFGAE